MIFNSGEEQRLLSESFRKAGNVNMAIKALDYVVENHSPFSLYVATKDRSDCTWIFDPKVVCYMLGGRDNYEAVFDSMFITEQERRVGIVMFIMRKVGPLVSIRFEEDLIKNVIKDLVNN